MRACVGLGKGFPGKVAGTNQNRLSRVYYLRSAKNGLKLSGAKS